MSFSNYGGSHGEPEYVYYNLNAVCGKTVSTGSDDDALARVTESRSTNIINDISLYDMSVVRFSYSGVKDIPLFIPIIETGQSDINKTVYKITIDARTDDDAGGQNNYSITRNIIFSPETINTLPPKEPLNEQDYSEYYYVHTFQHMVNLVNNTFKTIYTDLQTEINASDNVITIPSQPPHMVYNSDTNKFNIYLDTASYGQQPATVPTGSQVFCNLYFNSNMSNLFSNYPNSKFDDSITVDNKYVELKIEPTIFTPTYVFNSRNYYLIIQEHSTTSTLWSPVGGIVFTTDLIPSESEQTSHEVLYGNVQSSIGSNNGFENVITDIILPIDTPYDYKQNISYVPSGEYRITSLSNNKGIGLKNINININWRNRYTGSLIPLKLSNLADFSIKILFRRKNI